MCGIAGVLTDQSANDLLTALPAMVAALTHRGADAEGIWTDAARGVALDHRLVAFAWSLPDQFKVRDSQGKWILRKLLKRLVPRDLVGRPKLGFDVPIGDWLRGPLHGWASGVLDKMQTDRERYFEFEEILAKWNAHQSGKADWGDQLWCVLMFQAWFETQRL